MRHKERVIVGMSGGVDSSVAAALLKKSGYDVVGVTIKTWPKEECGESFARACCSLESVARARAVAHSLKIPFYVADFSAEFKKAVIDYFCKEYLRGFTPNPCIVCNEKIKFAKLLDKARELGASHIATGHYARSGYDRKSGRFLLNEGKDRKKGQAYFLFSLSQEQLASAIFPLGKLRKENVRRMAKTLRLKAFDAPSSQDVCFVRDIKYAEYIRKKTGVRMKQGEIVDKSGNVLGRHKGISYYTIGQRHGLGIAFREPLYVTAIDIENNRLVVGIREDIMKNRLLAQGVNWIAIRSFKKPIRAWAKIRYNHKKARVVIAPAANGMVKVDFDEPQSAPTPGQAVVFYDKDLVIGGGWIVRSQ